MVKRKQKTHHVGEMQNTKSGRPRRDSKDVGEVEDETTGSESER